MGGCYLDMMNPFPMGTSVLVKISAGNDFFQAKAKIVYSQMNMGAGVVFQEFDQASRIVLERWMDEAKRSEEHTSELQSRLHLVCRLLLEKKKKTTLTD